MAPLPLANPDATAVLNNLLSTISSLFKAKPPTRRPIFATSPEGIDSIELKDWITPSLLPSPSPSPPITPFEQATTKWGLKSPGPEKKSWLENQSLENTDEYEELVSNRWRDNRKRSVQYSEHPAMAVSEGEYRLTYSQELSLVVFIFLVTVFAGAAGMSAVAKLDRMLRRRLTRYLGELGKGQRMCVILYYFVYGAVTLSLWVIMLLGVFGLQQCLKAAIWG